MPYSNIGRSVKQTARFHSNSGRMPRLFGERSAPRKVTIPTPIWGRMKKRTVAVPIFLCPTMSLHPALFLRPPMLLPLCLATLLPLPPRCCCLSPRALSPPHLLNHPLTNGPRPSQTDRACNEDERSGSGSTAQEPSPTDEVRNLYALIES